jgi:hypothetical protein
MALSFITLQANTGLDFVVGQYVQVIHDINNYIFAQIQAYDSVTGTMTIAPVQIVGSGTYDTWDIVPSGNVGAASLFQGTSTSTIPVPSTTTTTTIAPAPTYFYYDVVAYTCPGCAPQPASIVARSSTSRITDFYYNIGDSYVYKVITEISYTPHDIDLDGSAAGTTCSGACSI